MLRLLYAHVHYDGISDVGIGERIHIVEAKRLDADFFVKVASFYDTTLTRTVNGVSIRPLVIIDTKSASFDIDDENDNAEASRIAAALKQDFEKLPVWLVGHVSKANMTRSEALSMRGAGAIENDAQQCLYFVDEQGTRYLVRGKTRFEARWDAVAITTELATEKTTDLFGDDVEVMLRWAKVRPVTAADKEAMKHLMQATAADAAQPKIVDLVKTAREVGRPHTKTSLAMALGGHRSTQWALINGMIHDQWLYEVKIPKARRRNPKLSTFLVELNDIERDALVADGIEPLAKTSIPASFLKAPAVGSVAPAIPGTRKSTNGSRAPPVTHAVGHLCAALAAVQSVRCRVCLLIP